MAKLMLVTISHRRWHNIIIIYLFSIKTMWRRPKVVAVGVVCTKFHTHFRKAIFEYTNERNSAKQVQYYLLATF